MPSESETTAREPTLAERARTLVHSETSCTLATTSRATPGFPFLSVAPFVDDDGGRPIFLFSSLAQHTANLAADARASFMVWRKGADGSVVSGPRVTVAGTIERIADNERDEARKRYLEAHAEAHRWVDFGDFSFHRMEVERVYHVAGFGSMGWIDAPDYASAEVDPLADAAKSIVSHMNDDHADALILYAKHFAEFDAERATMNDVDHLGFSLLAERQGEQRQLRVGFEREVRTADEARVELVGMVKRARAALASDGKPGA